MRNSIILAFIILFLMMTTEVMAKELDSDELVDLADFVTEQNLSLETWNVTIKEKMDQEEITAILNKMKRNHPITMTEDENSLKYQVKHPQKSESFVETYSVIIPKNGKQHAELTFVLEGDSWDQTIKYNYQQKINSVLDEWFTNSKQLFVWLKTTDDDIINSNVFINNIINEFKLEDVKKQSDNNSTNRKTIYGYTSVWSQKITIQSIPVNLQIAIAEDQDGDRTYTLGTPILINEY